MRMKDKINEIKSMVLNLCKDKRWDWKGHIEYVVNKSLELADKYDADKEIVEISAWLHDIRKLKNDDEGHHIKGSEEASKILKEMGYEDEKIEKIKHCIITHSSDKRYMPKTIEAKILASADALDKFDKFIELVKEMTARYPLEEAKKKVKQKIMKSWEKIMPEIKEEYQERFDAIIVILNDA
ncbi:MAG: HD domain-containing protein [Candidatus Woesearchaeota archaeon]